MPNFNRRGYRAAFQSQQTVPMTMTIGDGRASIVSDGSNSSHNEHQQQQFQYQYGHQQQQQPSLDDDDDNLSCMSDGVSSIGSFTMSEGFDPESDDVQVMFNEFSGGLRQFPPPPASLSPKRGKRMDNQQQQQQQRGGVHNNNTIDLTIDSRDDDDNDDVNDDVSCISVSSLGSFGTPKFQQQDGEIGAVFNAFGDEENSDTMNIDYRFLGRKEQQQQQSTTTMPFSSSHYQGIQTNDSFDFTPSPSVVRKTLIPKVTFSPNGSPMMMQTSRCDPQLQETMKSSSKKPKLLTPSPTHSPWVQKDHQQQVQFLSTHDVPGLGSSDSPRDTIVRRVKPVVVVTTRAWEAVDEQMLTMAVDALNKKRNDHGSEAYWNEVGRLYFAGTRTGAECQQHWAMKATMDDNHDDTHGKPPLPPKASSAKRGKKTAKKSRKGSGSGSKEAILLDGTPWSAEEDRLLMRNLDMLGNKWLILPTLFPNRSLEDIQERFEYLERDRQMEAELLAKEEWMNF